MYKKDVRFLQSFGTSSSELCVITLCAITPSLSSSANRRMSSNNFSLCFFDAWVQLTYKSDKMKVISWFILCHIFHSWSPLCFLLHKKREIKKLKNSIIFNWKNMTPPGNTQINGPAVLVRNPKLVLPTDHARSSQWHHVSQTTKNCKHYKYILSNIMRKLFPKYKQNWVHWCNTCASHSLSRSSDVRAFSLIINRSIFSSFSTYWGWWRLSRNTIVSTPFFWIHSCNMH